MYLEKVKTRAQTRYNLEKKKDKCASIFWVKNIEENEDKKAVRISKMAHNPKGCSCWMCGNPRRKNKGRVKARITFQEEKIFEKNDIKIFFEYNI